MLQFMKFTKAARLLGPTPIRYGQPVVFVSQESSKEKSDVEHDKLELVVEKLTDSELMPERPIKGLDLVRRIRKAEKNGSFSVDIFTGRYDHDYLIYPDVLDNRIENQQLKDQRRMVEQMWPQMWNDELQLQKNNFFNLFQLSVSEMMTIFEAIGASSRKCFEIKLPDTHDLDGSILTQVQISKSIISLIIRNCLTYWPINNSSNELVKHLLPRKHIVFGEPQETDSPYLPIGFCWTEHAPHLGNIPPQEWLTTGLAGGTEVNHHLIEGVKTRVLHNEETRHYLVYYRDRMLSDKYTKDPPKDEPNPASDPFIGCALLEESEVNPSDIYYDSAGFAYTDIAMSAAIPDNRIVFPAARKDATALNVKALGQVASCAVILGILKDSMKAAYQYLNEQRPGLVTCDIVQRRFSQATSRIFELESMIYFVSGMYDGLKPGFDAHMEAVITKIVANEYAHEVLQILQQICGSEMFIVSKLQDQMNILDSFLDGNIHNRLYLSTMGIIWFARNSNKDLNQLRLAPWYPFFVTKMIIREMSERRDFLTLDADIQGQLHPSLKEAATNLEFVLKRVKFAARDLCTKHGKDVTAAQSSLYEMAQLSIDAFVLTAVASRASKSYSNGSRNCELDVALAVEASRAILRRTRLYLDDLQRYDMSPFHTRIKAINEENLKHNGYYAESPMDPNI